MFRLSPITLRRWQNFRRNTRGFTASALFAAVFLVCLCANLIANDRPLFVWYKNAVYVPVFINYEESVFGGFLATTDYRDPFIADEIAAHGFALWPPIRFSYATHNLDLPVPAPSPPTWLLADDTCARVKLHTPEGERMAKSCREIEWNWLGTDDAARDVVARLLYGLRLSLLFGLLLSAVSSVVGIAAGAVQGYFGGLTDLLMQRFIEIWSSLPHLYLLIIVSSFLAPSFSVLLFVMVLFSWVQLVHVVRAEFLRARNFDYVRAARALGLSHVHIMVKHVLPNAMVATLTFMPFIINGAITTLTSLDFLGLGLPPGSPSLGELLLEGKANLQAPWLGLTGFFALASVLSLTVFMGEALRDAFDPRKSLS